MNSLLPTLLCIGHAGALLATHPTVQPALDRLVALHLVTVVTTSVGPAVVTTEQGSQLLVEAGHPRPTRPRSVRHIRERVVHHQAVTQVQEQGWVLLRHVYEARGDGRCHDGLHWVEGTGGRIVHSVLRCPPETVAVLRGYFPDRIPQAEGLGHTRLYTRADDLLRGLRGVHRTTRSLLLQWHGPALLAAPRNGRLEAAVEQLNERWLRHQKRLGELPLFPAVTLISVDF